MHSSYHEAIEERPKHDGPNSDGQHGVFEWGWWRMSEGKSALVDTQKTSCGARGNKPESVIVLEFLSKLNHSRGVTIKKRMASYNPLGRRIGRSPPRGYEPKTLLRHPAHINTQLLSRPGSHLI